MAKQLTNGINVVNLLKADANLASETTPPEVVPAKAPILPNMNSITVAPIISPNGQIKYIGGFMILGLIIVCTTITIISRMYIRSRYK